MSGAPAPNLRDLQEALAIVQAFCDSELIRHHYASEVASAEEVVDTLRDANGSVRNKNGTTIRRIVVSGMNRRSVYWGVSAGQEC